MVSFLLLEEENNQTDGLLQDDLEATYILRNFFFLFSASSSGWVMVEEADFALTA